MIGNGQGETEIPVDPAEQVPERAKDSSSHVASLIAYTFIQTESGTFDRTQNRKVPVPSVPLIFCRGWHLRPATPGNVGQGIAYPRFQRLVPNHPDQVLLIFGLKVDKIKTPSGHHS
jgi:hypothetical protein